MNVQKLDLHGAMAAACADFFVKDADGKYTIPDGGYLKIEPCGQTESSVDYPAKSGWAVNGRPILVRLVTDMYGPHPTVIGVICGTPEDAAVVWQE